MDIAQQLFFKINKIIKHKKTFFVLFCVRPSYHIVDNWSNRLPVFC
jgi:hypothetical protein